MSRQTITGTVKRHTYAHWRRGGTAVLSNLIRDIVEPLPPTELWCIDVDDPTSPFKNDDGRPYRIFRTRSGKWPLDRDLEGQTVTVNARVDEWSNGLGGYLSDLRRVEP